MGVLDRFRRGLQKTRDSFVGRLGALFGGRVRLEAETLDQIDVVETIKEGTTVYAMSEIASDVTGLAQLVGPWSLVALDGKAVEPVGKAITLRSTDGPGTTTISGAAAALSGRPEVAMITETNVPHEENISYFGDGSDEAQMVYNFTLPPLLFYTFVKQDEGDGGDGRSDDTAIRRSSL